VRDLAVSDQVAVPLLNVCCGLFLLTAVGVLWRRQVSALITLLTVQGLTLTAIAALLATRHRSAEAIVVAAGVGLLKAGVVPWMLRRVHAQVPDARETRPLVNVSTSLLAAAGLTLLAYAAARPLVALAPSGSAHATPVGIAVVLIGFFLAATRQRAISQIAGILLVDNGIAAVAFLATGGVPLIVELGVSADLALAVLVLQMLTSRLHQTFGPTDLDELRELHD
jgi:hydrogenase-4 component E